MEYVNNNPEFNQVYGYLVGTFLSREVKVVGALANMIEIFYPEYGYIRIFVANNKWFIGVREAYKYARDITRYNTKVNCITRIMMNHKVHNNLRTNLVMIKSLVEEYERRLEALVVDDQEPASSDDYSYINGKAPHDEVVIRNYIEDQYSELNNIKIEVISVDEDSAGTVIVATIELSDDKENYKVFLIETTGGETSLYHMASKVAYSVHEATNDLNRIGIDKSFDSTLGEAILKFSESIK